jgi:hypothetical protein
MNSAGEFVISWDGQGPNSSDYGIYAQQYNSNGTAQGANFQIDNGVDGRNLEPRVSMDPTGDFIVTWLFSPPPNDLYGVYARRYLATGTPEGTEFAVNTVWPIWNRDPVVLMESNTDFIVTWWSYRDGGDADGSPAVFAQRYQSDVGPMLYGIDATPLNAAAPLSTPIAPSLLVYDHDNNNWTGATVRISNNYVSGQDVLGFVNQLGITGSWDASSGTLTLSGTSSVSNYRTALRSVIYTNTSGTPNTSLIRTVSFTANDGFQSSDPVTRAVNVFTTSNPPVLSGVSGTGTYAEDDPVLLIAGNLTISDPDVVNLASATVTFTNWQSEDRMNFNNIYALQHTFTQDLVAHTATFTITGLAAVDHYQTLLRSVIYWDVSDNAVTTTRVATFTVSDGLSTSNAVTRGIAVSVFNHPPSIMSLETTPLTVKANDPAFPAQPISNTLVVGDPDSNNCTKATVQIVSGYENDANGHDVLSFVNQNGITGSWSAATGTLTLSGTSSDTNYRLALQSVTFGTSGSNVSSATRTVNITATDDHSPTGATSVVAARTVTVITTNQPPAVSGIPNTALSYVRGAAAVAVAPAAYIFDPDSINLTAITIQLTGNYQNGEDILAATAAFGITVSFNPSVGTLTLSGQASLANYQTVLQSVTYKTNTAGANTAARTLTFIANDGLAQSSAVSRAITLT